MGSGATVTRSTLRLSNREAYHNAVAVVRDARRRRLGLTRGRGGTRNARGAVSCSEARGVKAKGDAMLRVDTIALVLLLTGGLAQASSAQAPSAPVGAPAEGLADPDLRQLADWMIGSFSSQAQAAADSDYFDIRLQMVRIWPARQDACWLYIEQAMTGHEDRPYRQRVYRLTRATSDTLESAVFELKAPLRLAGLWRTPEKFDVLTPDSLVRREGCAIRLTRKGADAFVGSTLGRACLSTLRGASYATSEVVITPEGMTSWDRGFDASGKQVWGAVKGGYVFRKLPRASQP